MKTAVAGPPDLPGLTYVRDLGAGGYARVYLYEQAITRMRVAVKVLSGDLSAEVHRRFTAEANTMAELDHPYIVQVFQAASTPDGRPYLVMKYYPQANLAVRSRAERMSVTEVLSIGVKIACAVETAHQAGVLHRDIKPANILTSQYGEPGLTDFGIATSAGAEEAADGMSIPWAPPEVLWSSAPIDVRADVYALGATLWHLLVGHSPFEETNGDNAPVALMRRIRATPPPKTGREDVPAGLERLLGQTLSKDPSVRPGSALELARALQAVEAGERWAPTPLVLLGEGRRNVDATDIVATDLPADTTHPHADADGGDRTKLRTPRRLDAQPGSSVFAPPDPTVGATVQRPEVNGSYADADRTVRRSSPTEEPPAPVIAAPAGGPSRKVLIGAAVAVVAVVVGIGLVLAAGGGHKTPTASKTPITTPNQDALGGTQDGPGTPQVTGSVATPGTVHFTWSYTGTAKGDNFRWRPVGGQWTLTVNPSADVPDPGGQSVCIEVQVSRADGSQQSGVSDPGCAG